MNNCVPTQVKLTQAGGRGQTEMGCGLRLALAILADVVVTAAKAVGTNRSLQAYRKSRNDRWKFNRKQKSCERGKRGEGREKKNMEQRY